jgi:hypothetical protein
MDIQMTEAEFETVFDALQRANTPTETDDDIADVIAAEARAWTVVQAVRGRAGLPEPRPSAEASPTSSE